MEVLKQMGIASGTNLNTQGTVDKISDLLPKVKQYGLMILIAIAVYWIGRKLTKVLIRILDKSLTKTNMESSVVRFLCSVLNVVLHMVLIIMIVKQLGFDTTSLVAILGSAGLAIGLALQGSLSNFAGGVLILLMKPFRVGDYIVTSTYEGVVSTIDLFYTRLITADNRMVVLPNGTLSNSNIINVTNEPVRRLDLAIAVDYAENIDKVKTIILEVASKEEFCHKELETTVYVNSFDAGSISIGIRVWVDTENYWALKCSILEHIKEAFDENQIVLPYSKLDVNVMSEKAKGTV